jgi:hypothetical protein
MKIMKRDNIIQILLICIATMGIFVALIEIILLGGKLQSLLTIINIVNIMIDICIIVFLIFGINKLDPKRIVINFYFLLLFIIIVIINQMCILYIMLFL